MDIRHHVECYLKLPKSGRPMRQRLTDKRIRGLKAPAEGQLDIWDEILPGFGIRVGYGGRKAFIVGTRIKGKFRRITLKPSFPNLELAEARSRAQTDHR